MDPGLETAGRSPSPTAGVVALALAVGCLACDVLAPMVSDVRLVARSAHSVASDYANGFAQLAVYTALKLAAVTFGVMTVPAAFFALRRGHRWMSRIALWVLLAGLLAKGAQLHRENTERGPAPPPLPRAPRHCYEAALKGAPTPPDCVDGAAE